jgi:hypothetical protein
LPREFLFHSLITIEAHMRKQSGFNIRVRLSEAEGHEIHQMSLRENRSQSSAISILVAEALSARRAAFADQEQLLREGMEQRLVRLIKGIPDADVAS